MLTTLLGIALCLALFLGAPAAMIFGTIVASLMIYPITTGIVAIAVSAIYFYVRSNKL